MTADDEDKRGPVGSIVHAIDVMRHISESDTPLGVTAIARALSISPSSCFNILKTLVNENFIEFHPTTKTYALGTEALRLARKVMEENGVLGYVRPYLRDIASEFGVTSMLWLLTSHGRWVLIGFEESHALARIHMSIGQRLPKFAGSVGRCVAAFSGLDNDALEAEFGKVRWRRRPPLREHLKEVAAVTRTGWALDDGQLSHGVATISAPILDSEGRVRYSVACIMFSGLHQRETIEKLGGTLARVADRTSRHIFGRAMLQREKQKAK